MGPDGGGKGGERGGGKGNDDGGEDGNRGGGGQKHKTPDNITHPFPDYPFEKLFCRWAAGAGAGVGAEGWRDNGCYPVEAFLHT